MLCAVCHAGQDYLDQVQNRTKEKRYTFDIAYGATVRPQDQLARSSSLAATMQQQLSKQTRSNSS